MVLDFLNFFIYYSPGRETGLEKKISVIRLSDPDLWPIEYWDNSELLSVPCFEAYFDVF